jgi:SAM-dependent methyltransferase
MSTAERSSLVRARWDAEYRDGRYAGEPPIAFVDRIVATLRARPAASSGRGLYVGCGNGRNFLPLLDAGLELDGLDVSPEAVGQLASRHPDVARRLVCADFRQWRPAHACAYVIAIQVFQHGTAADADEWFRGAAKLLSPGGLLFVRVNSVATEIYHRHTVLERTATGGITIGYNDGPKQGMAVHFYARAELTALTGDDFVAIGELQEDVIRRDPPKTGSWAQWEGIWQRR